MNRLLELAAAMAAALLVTLPTLVLHAQPPAPSSTDSTKPKAAQDAPKTKAPTDPIERIKEEGTKRSQVMETLSYLTDVIGPRLTASPAMKRSNEWTRDTLAKWGVANAHLEAWGPFGRGWTLKRFNAQVVEPQCIPLIAYPKAWSPGTDGPITAELVYLDIKNDDDYAKYKGKLKGAVVLVSTPPAVPAHFEALGERFDEKKLLELADAPEPAQRGFGRRPPGGPPPAGKAQEKGEARKGEANRNGPPGDAAERERMIAQMRGRFEAAGKKAKFILEEGAVAQLDASNNGDGGTLFVAQASVPGGNPFGGGGGGPGGGPAPRRVWDKDAPKALPQITVAKEHYNRLVRMLQQGEHLKIALDVAVEFLDADLMGYNTVAEIPGTDLKDQVVMLGAHMDSWHSGTGATDNAAGVAVSMEVMRILKALDLKPRRTVRIGLWSGEEQGLLGSRAYVTKHFGRSPSLGFGGGGGGAAEKKEEADSDQKLAHQNFSAYYNLDNGTGKIRGVYMQGNEAVRPLFRRWLQPFREMGASTLTISNTGGTDHQSFDGVGLPGFQFIQDPVEYETRTHHSNMDVYDRIQADDMKQAAVIMAAFVYNTANLDEKLPRKPAPAGPTRTASAP